MLIAVMKRYTTHAQWCKSQIFIQKFIGIWKLKSVKYQTLDSNWILWKLRFLQMWFSEKKYDFFPLCATFFISRGGIVPENFDVFVKISPFFMVAHSASIQNTIGVGEHRSLAIFYRSYRIWTISKTTTISAERIIKLISLSWILKREEEANFLQVFQTPTFIQQIQCYSGKVHLQNSQWKT